MEEMLSICNADLLPYKPKAVLYERLYYFCFGRWGCQYTTTQTAVF